MCTFLDLYIIDISSMGHGTWKWSWNLLHTTSNPNIYIHCCLFKSFFSSIFPSYIWPNYCWETWPILTYQQSPHSPFCMFYLVWSGLVAWWVWCIGLDIITLRGKCICICIVAMLHCSTGRTRILKDVWRIEHKDWSASDAFKQIDF